MIFLSLEKQIKVKSASFSWEEKGDCVLHE